MVGSGSHRGVLRRPSHFQLLQFAGLFAFGLVLGALAWRTERLGPSIWAHLTFNVLAAAALVWTSTLVWKL